MKKLKSLVGDFLPVIVVLAIFLIIWVMKNLQVGSVLDFFQAHWHVMILSYVVGLCVGKMRKKRVTPVTDTYDDPDSDA